MMMTFNRLPDQDRAALVKHLLSHHDRYASLLMSAVESRHEQEWQKLQAELLQEGHAHLLSRAQHEWSREKEIYIYNHYKEMPIATVVKLLHVGEHSFTINRNKEIITVFTASEQGDRALTRLPKSELSVELIIEETTRKTVHLQYGEFRPLHKERRREIRVQSARPVDITLKDSAFRTWQGKVCDLSASGLGLTFKCETSFQAGDFLAFSMMLHGHKLIGKGAISWTNNRLGYCRAGMGIEYNQEIRLHLDHEVRQREKKIRAELKLRGIPDAFL